jgi:hypothetical protein
MRKVKATLDSKNDLNRAMYSEFFVNPEWDSAGLSLYSGVP